MHDEAIRRSVTAYQRFHAGHAGYIGPHWQLIKAMIWTEGGGPAFGDEWKLRPMQIGVPGDLGIVDVCTRPDMKVIAPPEIRQHFHVATIRSNAEANIEAGLALLHLKLAFFQRRTVSAASVQARTKNAVSADSSAMSRAAPIPPGNARNAPYIAAWAPFCPVTLYQRYNIGDGAYANKLEFCMKLIAEQSKGS